MHSFFIYLIFSALFLSTIATETQQPYRFTEHFLINCGSSTYSKALDGQDWEGDATNSKYFSDQPEIEGASSSSNASEQNPSVPQVPFMTARVFHSKFTYSFPLSAGQKFVRFYFYPATYSTHDKSEFFFSITTNGFTLSRNFSAYLTASASNPPDPTFKKEFIINVPENLRVLNITFNPSPSSYAFINGIEIVSMPENLYLGPTDKSITFVNNKEMPFYFNKDTALETVYRLNVGGGQEIPSINDTGMFRTWFQDLKYITGDASATIPYLPNIKILYTNDTPAYTAPDNVYTTYRTMDRDSKVNLKQNLTWLFPVDPMFLYLLRLHFCETQLEVTKDNQRVFFIFVDTMVAEQQMDVICFSGASRVPVYKEYVVFAQDANIRLQLHPNMETTPLYANAILNGLEILKINRSDGSLAGPNPEASTVLEISEVPRSLNKMTNRGSPWLVKAIAIVGGVVGCCVIILSLICVFILRGRTTGVPLSKGSTKEASLPCNLCRRFTLAEIRAATNNFDKQNIIGVGGFGNVYKGYIDGRSTAVAIKRLKTISKQGFHEFRTEIEMLSKLRHVHLVSLIGYCDDQSEMILVYEYLARGTLSDHLYQSENPYLPWKQRLEICIGTARGLHYLHTGTKHVIIHRDVKSTNILLDEKFMAKVSDFGLSKTSESNTHVSTNVKGSFGYLDPEYCQRQQLTEKSDVYSFGVVLLEVVCGRAAMNRRLPKEQVGLANWAQKCYQNGVVDQIVDRNLIKEIAPECLKRFVEMAMSCVGDEGIQRPSMEDVVGGLEFALQLQEVAEKYNDVNGQDVVKASMFGGSDCSELFIDSNTEKLQWTSGTSSQPSSISADKVMSESEYVFSVINNQEGR